MVHKNQYDEEFKLIHKMCHRNVTMGILKMVKTHTVENIKVGMNNNSQWRLF